MTKIDELMSIADEYANGKQWSSKQYTEQKRQELVAALEAALKLGEEPSFWLNENGQLSATKGWAERNAPGQKLIPLYTAPPAQTPPPRMTETEMLNLFGWYDGIDT
jgi:hypothetical protein